MIKLKQLCNENFLSDCFGNAYHYVKNHGGILVHGKVTSNENKIIDHAWVEDKEFIIDPTIPTKLPTSKYYSALNAVPEAKYTIEQAMINMVRSRNMGPWTEKEIGNRYIMYINK